MKSVPNILTGMRLVLSVLVFVALIWVAHGIPKVQAAPGTMTSNLILFALVGFVVAAVTDFFDGWLARRYQVTSLTGAILDPIADKILVCGALLGIAAAGATEMALPAGFILFREFAVSAMREVLAPKGIKLPVTFLAKTKTTIQLVAIAVILFGMLLISRLTYASDLSQVVLGRRVMLVGYGLLWLAAVVTVWTGVEYALAARRALRAQPAVAAPVL